MESIAANGIAGMTAVPPKFALALGDNFYVRLHCPFVALWTALMLLSFTSIFCYP